MFLSGLLLQLAQSAWTLILHLSARDSFPKPLPPAEEERLVSTMLEGDTAARDRLIEHNLRLVAHIAKKYRHAASDLDDLVSIGSIGLIKAVHTFKPESGKLTAYASRCIENEILMHLRANRKNQNTVVMSESLSRDRDGNEISILDLMGTDENLVSDEAENHIEAARAAALIDAVLDDREAAVIRLRYGLADGVAHPQHEVADLLGISRSYVSRIEKKALNILKKHME